MSPRHTKKQKYNILGILLMVVFCADPSGNWQAKNYFVKYWLWVCMSYHEFNNLSGLLNGDLTKNQIGYTLPWLHG